MMQINGFLLFSSLASMVASDVVDMPSCMNPECLSQKGQQALLQMKTVRAPDVKVLSETQPASFLDSGHNPSGAAAPLDEHGYASVADCGCPKEMQEFIRRAVFDLNLEVCTEGGLTPGLLPFHFSDGRQTYAKLTEDLLRGSEDACTPIATAGNCKEPPSDCPVFEAGSPTSLECMCSVSAAASSKLMFNWATVGQNNLGGAGPDTGAEELRFINVFGAAQPVRWSTYPNWCLDVSQGDTTNGNDLWLWECLSDGRWFNQQWTLPASGQGLVRWTPHPEKCMDAASTTNHAQIQIWDCSANKPTMQWTVPTDGQGPLQLTNFPTKCVDVSEGRQSKGTKLQIHTCNSANKNQPWTTPKATDATDLVITSSNAYAPGTSSLASDMSNGYASLGLRWGTETKFTFKFVVCGSNTSKVLDELHLTFHDIRAYPASGTDAHEYVWSTNYKGYLVDPATSLVASQSPDDKYTHFSGSASVSKPTSAGAETNKQRKASVMFFYDAVSEFSVTFGSTGTSSAIASLMFSGASSLASSCQS